MCVVVGRAHKKGPEKPSFAFGVIQCHREGWMEEAKELLHGGCLGITFRIHSSVGGISPLPLKHVGCRVIGIYREEVPEAWCLVSGS